MRSPLNWFASWRGIALCALWLVVPLSATAQGTAAPSSTEATPSSQIETIEGVVTSPEPPPSPAPAGVRTLSTPPPAPVLPTVSALPALTAELFSIDERMGQLEAERSEHKLIGPTILMAAGYGGAALFGLFAMVQGSNISDVRDAIHSGEYDEVNDKNDDGVIDRDDLSHAKRARWALVGIAGVHLSLGILGTFWRVRRASARRAIERDLEGLRNRRRSVETQLRMSVTPGAATGSFTMPF